MIHIPKYPVNAPYSNVRRADLAFRGATSRRLHISRNLYFCKFLILREEEVVTMTDTAETPFTDKHYSIDKF